MLSAATLVQTWPFATSGEQACSMGKLAEVLPLVPAPTLHPDSCPPPARSPSAPSARAGITAGLDILRTAMVLKGLSFGTSLQVHLFLPKWAQDCLRVIQSTSTCQFLSKSRYSRRKKMFGRFRACTEVVAGPGSVGGYT
eukprot:scaffold62611_cov33-Tisochrysis_lutea.AAC.2